MTAAGPVHPLHLGDVAVKRANVVGRGTPMLAWTFLSHRWTAPLPVWAFVIEHPAGAVLWDAGQDPRCAERGYFPGGLVGAVYRHQVRPRVAPSQTLEAQLAAAGMSLDDIRLVAVSHLHYDHAGNLPLLAGRPVFVSEAEHALATGKDPHLHGILHDRLDLGRVDLRPIAFAPVGGVVGGVVDDIFGGAHDLHGDGSLLLVPTPGHSPGSMSLLVQRDGEAPLLLVGDATYDAARLADPAVPDVGDRAAQRATNERIVRLRDALGGLRVIAAHDPRAPHLLAGA